MIAPARRRAAAPVVARSSIRAYELWNEAVLIRQEWLGHALSTEPADRAAAERALTGIHERVGRPRPRIEWVDSPVKALPLVAGLPTHDELYRWILPRSPQRTPPIASDLAALVSSLRSGLWEGRLPDTDPTTPGRRKQMPEAGWPELAPMETCALWSSGPRRCGPRRCRAHSSAKSGYAATG